MAMLWRRKKLGVGQSFGDADEAVSEKTHDVDEGEGRVKERWEGAKGGKTGKGLEGRRRKRGVSLCVKCNMFFVDAFAKPGKRR